MGSSGQNRPDPSVYIATPGPCTLRYIVTSQYVANERPASLLPLLAYGEGTGADFIGDLSDPASIPLVSECQIDD